VHNANVLLIEETAPLANAILVAVERARDQGDRIVVAKRWLGGRLAIGGDSQDDRLESVHDPAIDRNRVSRHLADARVPAAAAPVLAESIANREDVLELDALGGRPRSWRPLTIFERAAFVDALGDDLASMLPIEAVQIDRAAADVARPALNHCEMRDGIAHIRLVSTNGTWLAARTHALVHELGHALIGVARAAGRPYGAAYGSSDYGLFLSPKTFDRVCDEEALVRAIADAWLLRRVQIDWVRTWPGAIDACGTSLDGDDLAAFARFRLSQGLGLAATPVIVRRVR
jgi:hypothetical protein